MVECAKDPRPVETTYFTGLRKAGMLFAVEVNRRQTKQIVPYPGGRPGVVADLGPLDLDRRVCAESGRSPDERKRRRRPDNGHSRVYGDRPDRQPVVATSISL
jgi:hypothetical protein